LIEGLVDEAADRFGARGQIRLKSPPLVDTPKHIGIEPHFETFRLGRH